MLGRPQSPSLETAARRAIEVALKNLIERHYLYQKVTVDLSEMERAVKEALKDYTGLPPVGKITGGELMARGEKARHNREAQIASARPEIELRPWHLETRHLGDNPQFAEIHSVARIGAQAIGTPVEKMKIHFYSPAVHLHCGQCNVVSVFTAHVSSKQSDFGSVFPRQLGQRTEQTFTPIYRCESCRKTIYTILIRREGLRLHLCGFAPAKAYKPPHGVPESVAEILKDAEAALAGKDLYGALYHLRTMIEHYIRDRLKLPAADRVRGEDLVAKHNASLSPSLSGILPSLSVAYEKLSESLHARSGEDSEYFKYRDLICDYIKGVALLEKHQSEAAKHTPPSEPGS